MKEDATPSNFFEDLESDLPFTGIAADGSTDNFLDMYNLTPRQRVAYSIKKSLYGAINYFRIALWQRILIGTVGLLGLVGGILVAIFHSAILNYLVDTSNTLRERVSTQFILFLLLFLVGFPPMIGYTLFIHKCRSDIRPEFPWLCDTRHWDGFGFSGIIFIIQDHIALNCRKTGSQER